MRRQPDFSVNDFIYVLNKAGKPIDQALNLICRQPAFLKF